MFKIDIFFKGIESDQPLKDFVYDKIGGLAHYIPDAGEVPVRVEIGKSSQHHHKGPFFYAEANMSLGGQLLRASCEHEDLRNAITDIKDELKAQIMKFKDKSQE